MTVIAYPGSTVYPGSANYPGSTDIDEGVGTEATATPSALAALEGTGVEAVATPTATVVTLPPAAPASVTATAGNAFVDVAWSTVTDATQYRVYRVGTTAPVATLNAPLTSARVLASNGVAVSYQVSAVNAAGESTRSVATVPVTPAAPLVAPPAPASVTAAPGNGYVDIAWTAVAGATLYSVYQVGNTAPVVTLAAPTTTYRQPVTNGTPTAFQVSAINAAGESTKSAQTAAVTPTDPGGPIPEAPPPTDPRTDLLILDGLSLNVWPQGTYLIMEFTPPVPEPKEEWVEGADADGALLARYPTVGNGVATIKVRCAGGTRDATTALVGALVDKVESAKQSGSAGIPLEWTAGSRRGTFYVLSGRADPGPLTEVLATGNVAEVTLTLTCRPGMYGTEIAGPARTGTGPLLTLDVPNAQGDLPSDELRIVVTDTSSQARRFFEWGMEHLYYSPAAPTPLIIDSDQLVTSGYAGVQTTLTGAYDPNALVPSAIAATLYTATTAICSTGTQSHIGSFRVKAHVNGSTANKLRLAWRAGDGSYRFNDWISPPVNNQLAEIDLGLITIPPATTGVQSWEGRVDGYGPTSSGNVQYVDYLVLVPASDGYGVSRAEYTPQPGVVVARDSFASTTAGVGLSGRTAPAGGPWETGGSATDFVFSDGAFGVGESLARGTTVDSGSGRYAILGTTSYTNAVLAFDFLVEPQQNARFSNVAFLRWTDINNHVRVRVVSGIGSENVMTIEQVSAGVVTPLGTPERVVISSGTIYRLELSALSSGEVMARLGYGAAPGTVKELRATSTALATGGALATGRAGILDVATSGTPQRYYTNVSISALVAPPVVINPGRALEVRSDATERQSSDGSQYGRPWYRGSRAVLHPAGVQNRTTRIAVRAHRNDLAKAAAGNLADQIRVQVHYRPRWSTLPRAS